MREVVGSIPTATTIYLPVSFDTSDCFEKPLNFPMPDLVTPFAAVNLESWTKGIN